MDDLNLRYIEIDGVVDLLEVGDIGYGGKVEALLGVHKEGAGFGLYRSTHYVEGYFGDDWGRIGNPINLIM